MKPTRKNYVLMMMFFVVTSFGVSFFFSACRKPDPCQGVVCQHGGTAVSSGNSCGCNCALGYEGQFCQTVQRDKIIGTYTTTGMTNYTTPYISSITADTLAVDRIDLLFNQTSSCLFTLHAFIAGNNITIPSQISGNTNATMMGSGTITQSTNGTLFIVFHLTIDGDNVCVSNGQYTMWWTKQ